MPSLAETWRRIRQREAVDGVPAHLERRYGIRVANVKQLDVGVYRIDRHDGPAWVARLFPSVRPLDRAEGDADVLRFLEMHDFPADGDQSPRSLRPCRCIFWCEIARCSAWVECLLKRSKAGIRRSLD